MKEPRLLKTRNKNYIPQVKRTAFYQLHQIDQTFWILSIILTFAFLLKDFPTTYINNMQHLSRELRYAYTYVQKAYVNVKLL